MKTLLFTTLVLVFSACSDINKQTCYLDMTHVFKCDKFSITDKMTYCQVGNEITYNVPLYCEQK